MFCARGYSCLAQKESDNQEIEFIQCSALLHIGKLISPLATEMKTILTFMCLLVVVNVASADTNRTAFTCFSTNSVLTTNQLDYAAGLTNGTPAQAVLKTLGVPWVWGETDRDPKITQFNFALDWTFNGGLGPLDFVKTDSKQVTWLYLKPGHKEPSVVGSCVILFFTNNKLDNVVTGALGDMDCG